MSDNDKGFLGSLKSLVFEEEPDEVSKAGSAPVTVTPAPSTVSAVSAPTPSGDAEHVDLYRAIVADLQKAMGSASPYMLFADALASLESDVSDEALRYRAAIKVLKLESAKVLSDAQAALTVLEESCREKLGKLDEKETNEICQMERSYKSFEQQIVDTAAKLQTLQKQKEELGVVIATSRQKIAALRTGLTGAFEDVRAMVTGYATKLQQYVK